jgi:hypothetical protein
VNQIEQKKAFFGLVYPELVEGFVSRQNEQ